MAFHGHVVDELGRHIVSGRWAPGPLPNEDDLVVELGVSRTVVRESIKVLQAKGWSKCARRPVPASGQAGVAPPRPRRRRLAVRRHRRGVDLGDLETARGAGDDRDSGGAAAAGRRTEAELSEIEAYEHVEAAWAEPLAGRAADLDFHAAVVEAAHNGLLSHVSALIRVALEATAGVERLGRERSTRRWRAGWSPGPCAGDARGVGGGDA